MTDNDVIDLTGDIVAAYVANNSVPASQLPDLIASIHSSLITLGSNAPPAVVEKAAPAVSIKASLKPNAITCLVCGKKFKSLKRHLLSNHDMTPAQYRAEWSLPRDYPMVAPEYAATRSQLAKALGLGRKPNATEPAAEPEKPAKAKRVRTKKAAPATAE